MDTGYSKWRKLDNAALAFPLVTGKDDTRVFRFYCQLKEKVDGEILQSALDQAMEKYPLFQAVLRKGLFWFYLEHRSLRAVVKQETEPPCSRLYIPDKKSLLFQVSYDKNRINFEVFHALTDGKQSSKDRKCRRNHARRQRRRQLFPVLFLRYTEGQRKEKSSGKAERGEAGSFRYAHYRSGSFCKRYPPESPFLWCLHHDPADRHDAVFHSGRSTEESAETPHSFDDPGKSEKLFSISVHDQLLWMDRGWLYFFRYNNF